MAKSAIRNLKFRRFWRWVCVEVYGNPEPRKPIKLNRKRHKTNWRKFNRQCDKSVEIIWAMIQKSKVVRNDA